MEKPSATPLQKLFLVAFGLGLAGVLLGLTELVLALAGVGAPDAYADPFVGFEPGQTLFERATDADGETYYVTREAKRRFFNRQRFADPKPSGTYRIFTLGGSTTYGRPYDHRTSFSNWMELLLAETSPDRDVEVINAGGVSYASYRIVLLMRELVRYEPDLFVVLTGHNEFLEERTYGDIADDSAVTRLLKRAFHASRSVGLLRDTFGLTEEAPASTLAGEVQAKLDVWAGIDSFHRDDALREAILEHFRFNLQRMVDIARDHDVDLLFANPTSNVKDFSPFKSEHGPGVTAAEIERFDELRRWVRDCEQGLPLLREATSLSPEFAELHFRLGRCLLSEEDPEGAGRHLTLAKELDIVPLRALEAQSDSVRDTAERNGLPLVDLPRLLGEDSRERFGHPLLGREYFLDHVHPRVEIHQRIAEWILAALGEGDVDGDRRRELYSNYLEGLDPSYYAQRDLNLGKVLGWAGKNAEAREAFERAVRVTPDNPELLYNLGVVYQKEGAFPRAIEAYRELVRLQPEYPEVHFNLGTSYQSVGAWAEAADAFRRALEREPTDAKSHYNLARSFRELGRSEEELDALERAWALDPELPDIARLLGGLYSARGRQDDALGIYREHLERRPDDARVRHDMGGALERKGRLHEAIEAYRASVELDPDLAEGYRSLGAAYGKVENFDAAIQAFRRSLELEPDEGVAHYHLASLYAVRGERDLALHHFRRARELGVEVPEQIFKELSASQ